MKTAFGFMVAALSGGSLFILASDYWHCILLDKISIYLMLLYLLWIHWDSIPFKDVYTKICWLIPIIWVILAIGFNLWLKWYPKESLIELATKWGQPGMIKVSAMRYGIINGLLWIGIKPVILGILFWRMMLEKKYFSEKSDCLNDDYIFICLWRPNNARSLIQALFGIGIGSIAVYANGFLYGYIWKEQMYQKRKIEFSALEKKFILINTGVKVCCKYQKELEQLIGKPAGFFRCRCVWVIRDFLRSLDRSLAPHWWQLLPSRYGIKLLKWRKFHG